MIDSVMCIVVLYIVIEISTVIFTESRRLHPSQIPAGGLSSSRHPHFAPLEKCSSFKIQLPIRRIMVYMVLSSFGMKVLDQNYEKRTASSL